MILVPLTRDKANAFIVQHHRHNKRVPSHRAAIGCEVDGRLVGVAILANPAARALQKDPFVAEVRRCCVSPDAPPGTCSWLYSRIRRVAAALGIRRVITYTLAEEGGASLRAALWNPVKHLRARKGWASKGRPRAAIQTDNCPKIRWEMSA